MKREKMLGLIFFMIGCLPTYCGTFYKFNPIVLTLEEIREINKYDDNLLHDVNCAYYDMCSALPMSMEKKLFNKQLQTITNTLQHRYKLYIDTIPRTRSRSSLNKYYKNRAEEFYNLLQRINTYQIIE